MLIKKFLVTAVSSAVLCSSMVTTSIAGIPVIDIPRTITDIIEFLAEAQRWKDQLEGWESNIEVTTGNKDIGSLLNSSYYKNSRRYLPDNLINSIEQISAGNFSGTRLQTELDKIEAELANFKADLIFDDLTTPEAKLYMKRKSQTMLGMAVAEKSFNSNEKRLREIENLLNSIDSNDADAKSSTDLNSRMTGQTALLQTEQLKVQSYILKSVVEQNNRTNIEEANAQLARKNNLGRLTFK